MENLLGCSKPAIKTRISYFTSTCIVIIVFDFYVINIFLFTQESDKKHVLNSNFALPFILRSSTLVPFNLACNDDIDLSKL